MSSLISACLAYLASWFQSRHAMQIEIIALRHQLALYQRDARRPRIEPWDRLLWVCLSRLWSGWSSVLHNEVIILNENERHLNRLLQSYVDYDHD